MLSSVEGIVLDADTNEPIVYASVYLAHTTLGVATNINGAFKLENIPPGKYDLTISMLGYKTISKPMIMDGTHFLDFKVRLKSAAKELETVNINASKIKTRKTDFAEFKKFFLGVTRNGYRCKIINVNDIFVYKQDGKLIALASKPIEVVNEALGYKVFYELKEFEVNYLRNVVLTSGIPRFEELIPPHEKQRRKWEQERDRAYYGSIEHFLRSLLHKDLAQNFFQIRHKDGSLILEDSLITNNTINYKGIVYVTYSNEYPEIQNTRYPVKSQTSSIEFYGNPVTVFENGNFEEFHSVFFDGYFGWTSHIGELLPYGYQPCKPLDAK